MLSKNLAKYRLAAELSQAELAEKANVPQSAISEIESGSRKNPGVQTIAKLSEALNVSVETLLYEEINDTGPAA